MKIESVEFFYLAMPHIEDIGDGSQDTLLVRVTAGGHTGWGECEASPLTTIAAMVCPISHSACKPVVASVIGERLTQPSDIARIHQKVRANSMDLLQSDHALSGIDIALWDLLGKVCDEPVYRLLGYERSYPKVPYASFLFGNTPQETLEKAKKARQQGYRAIKCGWGPFGKSLQTDTEHVVAAREGVGAEGILLIDAGTIWGTDVEAAEARLNVLHDQKVTWLEEPFHTSALEAYRALASESKTVKLAGGEGVHNEFMAQHMMAYGKVGFIHIDAGRVGGLTSAKRVADYALQHNVSYVNHTFTSHLALSASLQPYAGLQNHALCEYPVELKPLAYELTSHRLELSQQGEVCVPDEPGLGMTVNLETVKKYLVQTQIVVNHKVLYETPKL
jgi:L-alanine-DL-glutamate epimerase-like enolase superfamily enzyme